MGLLGKLGVVAVALVVLVAVGWWVGVFGTPSATVEETGEWGNVTEDRTEIKTTVRVDNPNPVGVALGSNLWFTYDVYLNEVLLAESDREGVAIQRGTHNRTFSTYVINDRLPAWWVEYVRANETIDARIEGDVRIDAGFSASQSITRERTMMEDEAPMIEAMSESASEIEGEYPQDFPVTVYEVREGWAEWGAVNQSRTVVEFHFEVHNPREIPLPGEPDGLRVNVATNGVDLLQSETEEFSLGNLEPGDLIPPGETREVVLEVRMDNERIDEWFTSHVEREERTDVRVSFQLLLENPLTGETIALPSEAVAYDCEMQTAILIDQEAGTDCGDGGGIAAGEVSSDDPAGDDPARIGPLDPGSAAVAGS